MSKPSADKSSTSPALIDEADIGSGEKTPAQQETEALIRQIPPLPQDGQADSSDQPGIVSPS